MSIITPPILDLQSLKSIDDSVVTHVSNVISEAFGPDGPGLLLINGLRDSFTDERLQLFSVARTLAGLGPEKLRALEFPDVHYSVGWSRGRESFKGVFDSNKGSFYANPIFDDPSQGDKELVAKYPHNMHPNCWPTELACSSLERNFKSLGRYINEVGILLATHCDNYVQKHLDEGVSFQSIEQTLRRSRSAKGRLLHYYPISTSLRAKNNSKETMWCGYHNDHGTLTGLISGAYFSEGQDAPITNVGDVSAGLYVARGEGDAPEKVHFPVDCLAFQVGESAQIASGGILKATPHAVRPMLSPPPVSRVALAVFLQPNPWDALREPKATRQSDEETLATNRLVPPLSQRYYPNETFNDFTARTVESYYS